MRPVPTREEFSQMLTDIFEGKLPTRFGPFLNVRETHGKNRSPKLDPMIKSQGGSLADAYCLWGQQYDLDEVCTYLGVDRKLVKIPEGGGTQDVLRRTPARFITTKRKLACFITWRHGKTGLGHVERVCLETTHMDTVDKDYFQCIGYNTTVDGDDRIVRDGQGCGYTNRLERGTGDMFLLGYTDVYLAVIEAMGVQGAAPTTPQVPVPTPVYQYDVELLQVRLIALGFEPGPIDGDPGPKTIAAVKKFQLKYLPGSKGSGIVGPATVAMLAKLAKTPIEQHPKPTPETPTPTGKEALTAPLSWELPTNDGQVSQGAKPERKAWSEKLFSQLNKNYDLLMSASDIREIIPNFDGKNRSQRLTALAELMSTVAEYESSWNPKSATKDVNGRSEPGMMARGLFQMNADADQKNYRTGTNYTYKDLNDPLINIELGVKILVTVLKVRGKITFRKEEKSSELGYFYATLLTNGAVGPKVLAAAKQRISKQ